MYRFMYIVHVHAMWSCSYTAQKTSLPLRDRSLMVMLCPPPAAYCLCSDNGLKARPAVSHLGIAVVSVMVANLHMYVHTI